MVMMDPTSSLRTLMRNSGIQCGWNTRRLQRLYFLEMVKTQRTLRKHIWMNREHALNRQTLTQAQISTRDPGAGGSYCMHQLHYCATLFCHLYFAFHM